MWSARSLFCCESYAGLKVRNWKLQKSHFLARNKRRKWRHQVFGQRCPESVFFETEQKFRFYDRKSEKSTHFWARQLNLKWLSENQRAPISTHNKSEQFGISLARIGLGEDLERFMNNKKTRMFKPPLTRVGLAWISPAAAKKPGILSHPYLSNLQFHSFLKHLCTAETQNAETGSLAMPIIPVWP